MKKEIITLSVIGLLALTNSNAVLADSQQTPEPMIKIEIPASEINKINVNYTTQSQSQTNTAKVFENTKATTKKAVDNTKEFTDKTIKTTKNAATKSAKDTKTATNKAITTTKSATNKAVTATKNATQKTVDGTKDIIDNINPNKPVTKAGLEAEATIKTLKNERNQIKSAYNSRIKDINAKIKATENSTAINDTQRQSRIYSLNKEKAALVNERNEYVEKYNKRIEAAKAKKRNQ